MKTAVCWLAVSAVLTAGAVPLLAEEENWEVLVGDDGSIRFAELSKPEVNYTHTGLVITPEARRYPEQVKQLFAEEREFFPVRMRVVKSKMIGFLTWRVTKEAELVLARTGDTILVRAPVGEAEKVAEEGEKNNPFGPLILLSLVAMTLGNVTMAIKKRGATITLPLIALGLIFSSLVVIEKAVDNPVISLVSIVIFGSAAVISLIFATVIAVVPAPSPRLKKDELRYYRICTGVAAIATLALTIWLVI